MTKKISVWLAASLIIATTIITFLITFVNATDLATNNTAAAVANTEASVTEEPQKQKASPQEIVSKVSNKISELAYYYSNYYVGDIDVDKLVEGAAEGFVAYSGDKYGQYHTKEEMELLTSDYQGEFAGIGVSVTYNPEYMAIEILSVMDNSPALEAGLLPNDLVIAVNGEDVAYIGYNEAINRIRGEIGTEVTITIARGANYSERLDVTMVRAKVEEQSVTYDEIVADGIIDPIGYVRITTFNNKTPEQFKSAIGEGLTNHIHGFVIDLRNNGGGTLDSVVAMLDMVLEEGPIVRIQYSNGEETVYESDMYGLSRRVPIVLLVNDNTASAAELFTSSLRDYGRAFVVGEKTFGKGTVQTIIRLRDGTALRLSTAMYAPPFSDNFEGVGITPDIEVSLAEEYRSTNLFKLPYENDAQLQAAINLYK